MLPLILRRPRALGDEVERSAFAFLGRGALPPEGIFVPGLEGPVAVGGDVPDQVELHFLEGFAEGGEGDGAHGGVVAYLEGGVRAGDGVGVGGVGIDCAEGWRGEGRGGGIAGGWSVGGVRGGDVGIFRGRSAGCVFVLGCGEGGELGLIVGLTLRELG